MKTIAKKIYWSMFAGAALFLASCTSTTRLQVLQPAELTIPEHINTIATVDRSKPEKGWVNILEGVFTGEGINQDKDGRRRALDGLTKSLTRTPRFSVKHTGIEYTGSKGGGSFAPPLSWSEIEQICNTYDADAVVAIELYDSDNFVHTSESTKKTKDKDGKEVIEKVFNSRQNVNIRIGWRFYDPATRIIIDEYTTTDDAENSGSGSTEKNALNQLPAPYQVVRTISQVAGELYGMRIAPVWIDVNREFYSTAKGTGKMQMEQANRYVKGNEWERAAEIWRAIANNPPDQKVGGRAALNMAVANERAGKLESALDWAKRSYLEFDNKKARHYITVLEQRLNDQRRVEYQMNQKPKVQP